MNNINTQLTSQYLNQSGEHLTPSHQGGFTLIELLISITLGLLLSAAAMKLLSSGVSIYRAQASVGEIQDTAVFGFKEMNQQVSLANVGNLSMMDDKTSWTGIVLSGSEVDPNDQDNQVGNLRGVKNNVTALLTADGVNTSNVKDKKSDQLVIQYRAQQDMLDCEGNKLKGPRILNGKTVEGDMVIQRYFLRVDSRKKSGIADKQALVLACDAGIYEPTDKTKPFIRLDAAKLVKKDSFTLKDYGNNGTMLMRGVEHLRVNLGVRMPDPASASNEPKLKYMSIKAYKSLVTKPPIVGLQLGILARAKNNTNTGLTSTEQKFDVLDQSALKVDDTNGDYIRRVYTSTLLFRNNRFS